MSYTRTSDYAGFDQAANYLYEVAGTGRSRKIWTRNVRHLLIQLEHVRRMRSINYLGVSLSTGRYPKRDDAKTNPAGVTPMLIHAVKGLEGQGYLEMKLGYRDENSGARRMTRVWPTQLMLTEVFDRYGLSGARLFRHRSAELVVLRETWTDAEGKKRKKVISTPNSPEVDMMRKRLRLYNDLLEQTDIQVPYFGGYVLKSVYRVFNNGSLEQGGRFAGASWMNIPSKERSRITINGDDTVELDFQAMHIRLLYARKGLEYIGGDPYELEGYPREMVKKALLIALNASGGQESARKAYYEQCFKDGRSIEEDTAYFDFVGVMSAFIARHPAISEFLFTGVAMRLMNLDSQIAEYILDEMTNEGIPVLSVHDSFIVQSKNEARLRQAMIRAYETVTGCSPVIKSNNGVGSVKQAA